MRKRYTVAVECAQEGCRRRSCFETSSRREERDTRARQDGSWKCKDHRYLDRNLTTSRPEIVTHYRLTRDPETDNSYWVKVGSKSLSSGFSHGPGFVARQEDWPDGAILEVRATVTLPGEEDQEDSAGDGIDTASAEYHDGDLARSTGQPVESCPFPAQVVGKNAANWKAGWHGVCDEDLADTRHDNALTRSERLGGSL